MARLRSPRVPISRLSYEVIFAISGKLNAASRTAAEINMLFAVLPETICQGLFNHFFCKNDNFVNSAEFPAVSFVQFFRS